MGSVRGAATLAVATVFFLATDLIQRTVIVLIIKAWPRVRERVLTRWAFSIASCIGWLVSRVGGAKLDLRGRVPGDAGTLILMNHQSLLDIPLGIHCVVGAYPRVVARDRYRTGYPLVSHMIRLYRHPTVRPGEHAGVQLDALRRIGQESNRAILIYPEGSRTPDGQIRRFKTAGLKALLSARSWSVYLLVVDGMCEAAGLGGFVKHISSSTIIAESEGPFAFDGEGQDPDEFIALMETRMRDKLDRMRQAAGGRQ